MKFLILGSTGMAGHMIAYYLHERGHQVVTIARRNFPFREHIIIDIFDFNRLSKIISDGKYDYIVNCIGILNRDAEEHKSLAVRINSELPHFLVELTKNTDTKIIHLSTDCVFSGDHGKYIEIDQPDGRTFYDRTKALGEIIDDKNITFRNSIIGPDLERGGIGLFNWFMQQEGNIQGYKKSIWSGVTTLFLAQMIEKAAIENIYGLYQLTNNTSITKFDLLNLFNKIFERNIKIIAVNGVIADKSLINTKSWGIAPSYEVMVNDIQNWILNHKEIYRHYKI